MNSHRHRGGRGRRVPLITLPLTVQQAQRLIARGNGAKRVDGDIYYPLASLLYRALGLGTASNERDIAACLDRLAALKGADYPLLTAPHSAPEMAETQAGGESRPKGTDKVAPQSDSPLEESEAHGGNSSSGEVPEGSFNSPSATYHDSQSEGLPSGSPTGTGVGHASLGESQANAHSPETGSNPTSGDAAATSPDQAHCEQRPAQPGAEVSADSSFAAATAHTPSFFLAPEPRDAQESQTRSAEGIARQTPSSDAVGDHDTTDEDEQPQDGKDAPEATAETPGADRPTQRKKWGAPFKAAGSGQLSASGKTTHGGITASLNEARLDPTLVRRVRERLAALVGESSQEAGPRRDWPAFCTRLLTHRNPAPARREEAGRPVILVLADVSGSCASFSQPALAVARACGAFGVPGAEVLVLAHSNGCPSELELAGRPIPIDRYGEADGQWGADNRSWYLQLLERHSITVVIALGDWDAVAVYCQLVAHPRVERLIWLDNAYCRKKPPRNRTTHALAQLALQGYSTRSLRHKLVYRDACGDAKAFANQIK
ncbi:hypothetical protein [Gloeobacter morelensis]|uniref:hypothetical protein n=1 Tax=Gloeobacter morelensis TaxID=2907343 RepID=UPI001E5FF3D3|nr:hypothetical protein [Gloeobacter morelensis]UFP97267.1 hypothetical protein ISF26_24405 [Gloeobacter morelensis MG652769]